MLKCLCPQFTLPAALFYRLDKALTSKKKKIQPLPTSQCMTRANVIAVSYKSAQSRKSDIQEATCFTLLCRYTSHSHNFPQSISWNPSHRGGSFCKFVSVPAVKKKSRSLKTGRPIYPWGRSLPYSTTYCSDKEPCDDAITLSKTGSTSRRRYRWRVRWSVQIRKTLNI